MGNGYRESIAILSMSKTLTADSQSCRKQHSADLNMDINMEIADVKW